MGKGNFGITAEPSAKKGLQEKLTAGRAPDAVQWNFSFQYWNQIEFFGLDRSAKSWFVSLLERLRDLSKYTVEEFLRNIDLQDAYRFHAINWSAKNCPIKRQDLHWIPPHILENNEDFPLVQIHVSKALGRIVGFFDSNHTFNIVLLDPLHNIQPAKCVDYKIRDCDIVGCQYTSLLYKVSSLLDRKCKNGACENAHELKRMIQIRDNLLAANCAMIFISDENKVWYDELEQSGIVDSIDDIFTAGLEMKLEELSQ